MPLILPFSQLSKSDASIAGGKGASLGEMTRAGIPVPPGFVVLSTTFDRFLQETDLLQEIEATLATVNHQEIHTVERASEIIQTLIKKAVIPQDIADNILKYFKELGAEYVAVRSSATAEDGAEHAWAGQLDSFLNTTEETLLENVQKCWASLFTPRAIFYRFELISPTHADLTRTDTDSTRTHADLEKISVAVVVQKMIQSEVSGIAFSVHPITEDRNQLIIEAGYGLGEAIVSGSITPDSYVVEKEPRRIIDKNISTQERGIFRVNAFQRAGVIPDLIRDPGLGFSPNEWRSIDPAKQSQQKLSDDQILELSELIIKIEDHYDFPCDIEWASEDGKFFIVQSRPITTLRKEVGVNSGAVMILEKATQSRRLPIDPKKWELEFRQRNDHPVLMADFWCRAAYKYFPEDIRLDITRPDYLYTGSFKGYVKKEQKKDMLEKMKSKCASDPDYIRYIFKTTVERISGFDVYAEKLLADGFKDLSKAEVLDKWKEFNDQFLRLIPWFFIPYYLSEENIITDEVRNSLEKYKAEIEKVTTFNNALLTLVFPTKHSDFQREQKLLYELVKGYSEQENFFQSDDFKKFSEEYLKEFSWMTTFVLLPVEPLTGEGLIAKIESFSKTSFSEEYELQQKQKKRDENLVRKLNRVIMGDKKLLEKIEQARELGWLLTASVGDGLKSIAKLIPFYKKVSESAGIAYADWVQYTADEISSLLACVEETVSNQEIADRKRGFIFLFESGHQYLVSGEAALESTQKIERDVESVDRGISELKGQSVSRTGVICGRVRLGQSANVAALIHDGEILVSAMTTPDFVPAMKRSGAIITDEGGLLCHASIISREIGKPCIIGTKIATQVLHDGDLVEVDADHGVVRIVEKK